MTTHHEETAMPRHLIPDAQAQAFNLAICRELGIDPEKVSAVNASHDGMEDLATIHLTAHLPSDRVVELLNGAGHDVEVLREAVQ